MRMFLLNASLFLAALFIVLVQSASTAPPDNNLKTLKGVVERLNHNPRGEYDAVLMMSEGKLVQINFPPHMAAEMTKALAGGDAISVVAAVHKSKGDHPVYEFQKITTAKGEEITIPKPQPKPRTGHVEKINGVVKYLNYTREGEVNGAVLDSGDCIHLTPHGAEMVKLAVGQKLTVQGEAVTMAGGHKAVDAVNVNGKEVHHEPPPDPKEPGRKPLPPPADDRE